MKKLSLEKNAVFFSLGGAIVEWVMRRKSEPYWTESPQLSFASNPSLDPERSTCRRAQQSEENSTLPAGGVARTLSGHEFKRRAELVGITQ